jgi:glutamate/tyrosine decarboxylase-like PLP-dependent enzyme
LEAAFTAAMEHLDGLDRNSVAPTVDRATLLERLDVGVRDAGLPADQVVRELAEAVRGGIMGSASGRFFAWVIGGTQPAALAADWMTAAWDNNAGLYACSPAASVVEEIAGRWLKDILRLPSTASFALTTGCQMAHVTCLAAARHAVLARLGWDVEDRGLCGAPAIRVVRVAELHGSIDRALRLLGIGSGALTTEANWSGPTILVLQAGDINTGEFDDFERLIPEAKARGAWVHIDGAFGLWAAASPRLRHLVKGFELADSWTTDGHKWLNTPFDCGYAFVADPEAHRAAMSHQASYLTHADDARDPLDWTPEFSRRARGFPTYAALRQLGRSGVAELVERCCDHAKAIVCGIGKLAGAEILAEPIINQGLLRFGDRTDEVIAAVNRSGEAFFSGTTWRGMRAMRVSVSNWRTSEEDVARTIAAVKKVLEEIC